MPGRRGEQLSGPGALPLDVIARDGLACKVSLVRSEVAIQPIARTATSPGLEGATPGYSIRAFGGKPWRTDVLHDGEVRIATADRIDARKGLLREIALSAAVPFAVAMAGSLVCCGSVSGVASRRSNGCAQRCCIGARMPLRHCRPSTRRPSCSR